MKYCILFVSVLIFLCMDESTQRHSSSVKHPKAKHSNHRNVTSRRCRWVCKCPSDGEENRTTLSTPATATLPAVTTRSEQETSTSASQYTTQQSISISSNGTVIPPLNIPNDSLGIGSILNGALGGVVSSINAAAQNGSLAVNSTGSRGTAVANGGNVDIEAGVEPPPSTSSPSKRRVLIGPGGGHGAAAAAAGIAGPSPQVSHRPGGQVIIANTSRLGGDAVAVGGPAGSTYARGGNATFIVN